MDFIKLSAQIINERKVLIFLFLKLIIGAVFLILCRFFIETDKTFLFLIWNLFLALIPLILSSYIKVMFNSKNYNSYVLLSLGFVWLLFFPNAPYILTDFIHLSYGSKAYLWLDILTISWFAISAFLAAIISLNDIFKLLETKFSTKWASIHLFFISILTGFGIYLGRFLRFNSWDLIQNPFHLIEEISMRLVFPHQHLRTWFISIGFGMLLFLVFKTLQTIQQEFKKH